MTWNELAKCRIGGMSWERDGKARENLFCYLPNSAYLAFKILKSDDGHAKIEFGILSEYYKETGCSKERHIQTVGKVKRELGISGDKVLNYGDDRFGIGYDKEETYIVFKPGKNSVNVSFAFDKIAEAFEAFNDRLEKSKFKAKLLELTQR